MVYGPSSSSKLSIRWLRARSERTQERVSSPYFAIRLGGEDRLTFFFRTGKDPNLLLRREVLSKQPLGRADDGPDGVVANGRERGGVDLAGDGRVGRDVQKELVPSRHHEGGGTNKSVDVYWMAMRSEARGGRLTC